MLWGPAAAGCCACVPALSRTCRRIPPPKKSPPATPLGAAGCPLRASWHPPGHRSAAAPAAAPHSAPAGYSTVQSAGRQRPHSCACRVSVNPPTLLLVKVQGSPVLLSRSNRATCGCRSRLAPLSPSAPPCHRQTAPCAAVAVACRPSSPRPSTQHLVAKGQQVWQDVWVCELVEVQVGELHKPGQTTLLLLLLRLRKCCCMTCVQQQPAITACLGGP